MKLSELEGLELPFRGMSLQLKIKRSPFADTRLLQRGAILNVSLSSLFKTEEEQCREIESQLLTWYKAQARRYFAQEVELERSKYNFNYKSIALKDTVSRWGSCSSKKNFNFNWRLIMAPPEVLSYVVNHEITHLEYMNHSKEFWSLLAKRYPRYKEAQKWLKEKGSTLMNFGF